MRIGIPREVKDGEARVALTPDAVGALVAAGHGVGVERGAGATAGFSDAQYREAGAEIAASAAALYSAGLVVKVKELQRSEYALLQPGSIVFGFQQLGRDPALLDTVLAARASCIACEMVRDSEGGLPLLAPMSRIAGRLAPLIGAHLLQRQNGGSGVLLTGTSDVAPARVVLIGAGQVGGEAARVALALGCTVTLFGRRERNADGLAVQHFEQSSLAAAMAEADLVIGAVLEPGALSPKLITRDMLRAMRPGSVFIDIGIDMGGISVTSRQTSFSQPTYVEEGVLHYCVPNIPASVPRTATLAFSQAILPYVRSLAQRGLAGALQDDPGLRGALLVHDGKVTHERLARDTGRTYCEFDVGAASSPR